MDAILEFFQSINPIGADGATAAIGTFWAIIPPIVAIALALITKEVYISLFVGIVSGALLYTAFNPLKAMETIFTIMGDSLGGNINICIFLVFLGIVVSLVTKSGASRAYGEWASRAITTKRGALFATTGLGVLIFVDDYFNCLTVGTVMSPVTNRHGISRSKLAYIIDATAAPVCIIAPISSWAAAVGSSLPENAMVSGQPIDGFNLFLRTIPYNFYALLTVVMIIFVIATNLDFGPMRKAEAKLDDAVEIEVDDGVGKKKAKGKVLDLVLPIAVLIICCVLAMLYTGGIIDNTSRVGNLSTSETVTVSLPENTKTLTLHQVAEGQDMSRPMPIEQFAGLINPKSVGLPVGTEFNGISKSDFSGGALTTNVKATMPKGTVLFDTDDFLDVQVAMIAAQQGQQISKEDLRKQLPEDFMFEVISDTDLEVELTKGTPVSYYGVGMLIKDSFADCNSSLSLVLGSLVTLIFIFLLYLPRKVLTYKEFADSIVDGFKAMVPAIAILTLAWTLSGVCRGDYLDSGAFVKGLVETYNIPFGILPAVFFLIALGLGFATGTSWGTFGILIPIIFTVIGDSVNINTLAIVVAAILAGAVCGDHISPISDTTILASTGARCNHIKHVQTQMPYALIVAAVCFVSYLIAGFVPSEYSGYIGLGIGFVLLLVVLCILRTVNKPLPAFAGKASVEAVEDATESSDNIQVEETVVEETIVETSDTEEKDAE